MAERPTEHDGARPNGSGGPGRSDGRGDGDLSGWYRMAGVGMEFVAAVALFGGGGWLLDRWLGTKPWLLLAGIGVGFAVGLYMMARLAMKSFRPERPTGTDKTRAERDK